MTGPEDTGAGDPAPSASERLTLADWRRRIAELYAAVRTLATDDPEAAWDHWRTTRDELYRTHPQSPVPALARGTFRGRYWPYDPVVRFEVEVRSAEGAGHSAEEPGLSTHESGLPQRPAGLPSGGPGIQLPTSSGEAMMFAPIGEVTVPFPAGPRSLGLFWMAGYAGGLFLPFRDASNGSATYGAGRYLLDTAKSADLGTDSSGSRLILDFNFAFQPSCAFDPRWSCPLAPPGNRLDLMIEAGERLA